MRNLIVCCIVMLSLTVSNAKACDQILVPSSSSAFVVPNVVVPESVSFFAASHPVTFVTNRVLTTPSFFVVDQFGQSQIIQPQIIQPNVSRIIRQRIVIRR